MVKSFYPQNKLEVPVILFLKEAITNFYFVVPRESLSAITPTNPTHRRASALFQSQSAAAREAEEKAMLSEAFQQARASMQSFKSLKELKKKQMESKDKKEDGENGDDDDEEEEEENKKD